MTQSSAVISPCGKYRYVLRRQWNGQPCCTFIMLNPSTADASLDDPTIRRCIGFAKKWGCGSLQVLNLFAVRTPSPLEMRKADDPVGPDNRDAFEQALQYMDKDDGPIICAWGANGDYMEQDLQVLGWLDELLLDHYPECLGITKEGHPKHPLYLSADSQRIPYKGRRL